MPPIDPRPLAGVTVVDLTRVLAGPYCTLVLANLGARVVKVERPPLGDDARAIGPFVGGRSLYFAALNYGKESVALDLRAPGDRAVFDRLLGCADVMVENFRPGVLERLGYGWPALRARWPRLVYAALSGFGHTGPLRERPAFDMVAQAMGGVMSLTGHPDGPPARVGVSIGDIAAGLFGAVAIVAALLRRGRAGAGTMIDVAMLDCQLAILENALTTHLVTGALPGRLGTRHPNIAPFQAFAAKDGAQVVVCAGHDALFHALCEALGVPALADDPRYATTESRRRHVDALAAALAAVVATRPAAEWLAVLEGAGVPCAPVNTVADAVRMPQVAARRMVRTVDDPAIGPFAVAGDPIKLADVPEPDRLRPPPALDADRAAVLAWLDGPVAPDGESAVQRLDDLRAALDGPRASRTLLAGATGAVVLVAVGPDDEVVEYAAAADTLLHVLDGSVDVRLGGRAQPLRAGEVLRVPARVPYGLGSAGGATLLCTTLAV